MKSRFWMLALAGVATIFASLPASAQTQTARQAGMRVALERGVSNPDCYARVFAKHAIVVERTPGVRTWFAPFTPAYNAELRNRCGFDRTAQPRISPGRVGPTRQASRSETYAAGLRIAAARGYSNPDCYARVFSTYASVTNDPTGRGRRVVGTPTSDAFVAELWNSCRISR